MSDVSRIQKVEKLTCLRRRVTKDSVDLVGKLTPCDAHIKCRSLLSSGSTAWLTSSLGIVIRKSSGFALVSVRQYRLENLHQPFWPIAILQHLLEFLDLLCSYRVELVIGDSAASIIVK